ncbi:MAG: addiction module antidote protein, HigA family [Rhodospirillaceae bacterium]|nr:addiction module antidote protein, HigA family [Rhodospirillales bacterium]MAX46786.1 addiction module antidote protein, HigA family [Rhodospirillaceae bacterium]|tara:strand:- start:190 stop:480 length:291 start_codon:yes stop_codon:yes gene_type:complete
MSMLESPMHPGEVLKELYLEPMGIGASAFAKHLSVPRTRIERIVKGTSAISTDTAMRLARACNTTPHYWLNMQTNFDLSKAAKEIDISGIEPIAQS